MAYFGSPGTGFSFGSSDPGSGSAFRSSNTPSFILGSFPSTAPSPFTSPLSAPPLFSASSSPSFSDPNIGGLHTADLNFSITTGSASIPTNKVPIVPQSYSPPPPPSPVKGSRKKVSTSAPRNSTVPVIGLKLMIEKKKDRVVFAESDKDFIDLLFSFLTLPVGTIIRLLEDKSPPTVIGCMNSLYKSIENLDAQLFVSEACKKMLLQLTRLPAVQCKNLKAMIEKNLEPNKCFYFCANSDC
ncbi:hypothetical protein RHMOL_Rhmol03G0158000 [Rhododendron molle]|uniref:Uncharacterized protein n=1 Tax=Rhododendron molle TaxID=49168 RepID=A0ACC0PGD5_RHOML|nr:hypothetical protein RHMOL_Rhmol03G0158000 [Rhododendron molle]